MVSQTVSLMQYGELFKIYMDTNDKKICKLYLNKAADALVCKDFSIKIEFNTIDVIHTGYNSIYNNINPSSSFMLQIASKNAHTNFILLEIMHEV